MSVADREQRDLWSLEELLDDNVSGRGALQRAHGLVHLGLGATDVDALPCREPVCLHDAWRSRDRKPRRGRHARGGHDLLRERLRAFDPGGRSARPEDEEAESAKRVGETEHERQLGPDHDEVDVERAREAEEPLRVLRPNRMTLGNRGDPRVSGCGVQLRQRRRPRKLPGKRMFATARADDEYPHRSSLRRVSLVAVDDAAVTHWLTSYVDAWRTYDEAAIGALFSEDAVYRFHPWDEGDEAVRGREAIVSNWLEEPDAADSWTADVPPVGSRRRPRRGGRHDALPRRGP